MAYVEVFACRFDLSFLTGAAQSREGHINRLTDGAIAVQRYYFPIIHKGQLQADEQFNSAEQAGDYGARIAQDIGSDPEYDPVSGTIVIVVDADGSEIGRHVVLVCSTSGATLQRNG